ncbi:MAG: hypothetical protein L6R39_005595 [Caloplaca ligustica]|nr:MAG: hypothetical protein L6R39_005595 [Caloplaca ligustica]
MPKGRHIQELAGGGEIMRVIPGRDPSTFQQRNHYFLLFPNPACARMYQKHVTKLHILARSHTPASLGSRLPPTEGTIIGGQDAHTFLQDYALYPPSQRITTTSMATPFSNTVKPLIEHQGHPQLTAPTDRTGRSVLFWVDACSPSTRAIRSFIDHDSRDRGLPWAIEGGSGSIERLDLSQASSEDPESTEQVDSEVKRRSAARWIVSFVDENEARRFVRAWRRRPFPSSGESAGGEDTPLVNAEFLW